MKEYNLILIKSKQFALSSQRHQYRCQCERS